MAKVSVQVGVCESVKDALNTAPAGSFEVEFRAVRSWADWNVPLSEDGLKVDVVPGQIKEVELENREDVTYRVDTDILIRRKIDPTSERDANSGRMRNEPLDQLSLLTEQLHEFWEPNQAASDDGRLEDFEEASWEATEIRVSYARDHLQELSQWTSIVRVTHNVTKAIGTALTIGE